MKAFPIVLLICAGRRCRPGRKARSASATAFAVAGIDAPVFDTDCATRLAGAALPGPGVCGQTPDSLSPVGWVMPFRTGQSQRATFTASSSRSPEPSQDDLVYTQLRAWEARAGASFEEAVASGGKYGMSNIVPMRTVMPPGTPNEPVGLQSFCLVPEPGSGTLLLLGGGLWLLAARRRGVQGLGRPGGRLSWRRTRGRLFRHKHGPWRRLVLDHSGIRRSCP
jgi:hypothetical protein